MTYISVPNVFASGTTFLASQFNANFAAFVDGLSDGSKDVAIRNINGASLTSTSSISVTSNVNLQHTLGVTNTAIFSSTVSVNSSATLNKITVGSYVSTTIVSNLITATQSYMSIITATDTEVNSITNSLADGSLIILKKDPTSPGDPIIKNGILLLGADRTLSSVHDILILQKQGTDLIELQFQNNS